MPIPTTDDTLAGPADFEPPKRSLWQRYLLDPVVGQLKQGITPEKISLSFSLATALSVFPVVGVTTLFCIAAGIVFRLNHPIVQIINYFSYPLQLVMIVVFIRIGEAIFHAPHASLAIPQLLEKFHASPTHFFEEFGVSIGHGIVAWLILTPPATVLLYFILVPTIRLLAARLKLSVSSK